MARVLSQTGRVQLRRPRYADCDPFLAAVVRSRELHRPWVEPPSDVSRFAAWLRGGRRQSCELHLVCTHEGDLAGVVNVSEIVRGIFLSGYLGYYAFEPFAGRGLMREGIELVIRRAFSDLALHRLEANVQPGNLASIALVRRLGFRREGLSPRYLYISGGWRDHERWALTSEDWQRARGEAAILL